VQASYDKKEAVMDSEDCKEWPEFYVDYNTGHSHIIHRTLKARIEDLEVELKVLRDDIAYLKCKVGEDQE